MIHNFKPIGNENFTPIEINILTDADTFFSNNINYFNNFLEIISQQSIVSCNMIYRFVTNFCKNNNNLAYIRDSYKNNLKQYSTEYFDPFCRKHKLAYTCNNIIVLTSIGQLNFFKWGFEHKIDSLRSFATPSATLVPLALPIPVDQI